jgi:hypothetical protein
MIPVFLFKWEVLRDGLHHKVGSGEGGLAAGGQHQLPQGVRHKGVPRLQKRMPKNVVFTGLSHKRRGIILSEADLMSGVFQNFEPPPPPHCLASTPPPPAFGAGGGHIRWVERGWGFNILEDARHCSVLYICKYFVPINVSWPSTRVTSGWPRNKNPSKTYIIFRKNLLCLLMFIAVPFFFAVLPNFFQLCIS